MTPLEWTATVGSVRVGDPLVDRGARMNMYAGRATGLDLNEEEPGTEFTPAVPFVAAFSGIVGAAQTMRRLLGAGEGSVHFQLSFLSYRARKMRMRCASDCECRSRRGRAVA